MATKSTYNWMTDERFRSCFTGLGKLKNHTVFLYLKENAKPYISPPRPQPFYLRNKIDEAVNQMLKEKVIEEHSGLAEWVSNLAVIFKEGGQLRVTVDLLGLNSELRDTRIPIPTPESIKAKLSGCKVFSKLDFKQAFHQLVLDPASRRLTVFRNGPKLYRYKRLCMGLKPASGELSAACAKAFRGLKGVFIIHDDVVVAALTVEEHNANLCAFLDRVSVMGMTLNPEKCILGAKSIRFWGVLVGQNGISPDPEKIEALQYARTPTSKKELISFLCMARANQDFIPAMASRTSSLRALTHKHARFRWEARHKEEFQSLCGALSGSIGLAFFNPKLPTHVIVDAHTDGLCAILAQGDTPLSGQAVAVASRATSEVEKRYPQLDLEAVAVDFGLRRFRPYLIGNPNVVVHSDHKPLVPIFRNSRQGSIRIERIKLRHQDITYRIQHLSGVTNPADFCSRSPIPWHKLPRNIRSEADEPERLLYHFHVGGIVSTVGRGTIVEAARRCPEMSSLAKYIQHGKRGKTPTSILQYAKVMEELSVAYGGTVFRGTRMVIPVQVRRLVMENAHGPAHLGISAMKRRLRAAVWFPGMDTSIEQFVKSCNKCQIFTPAAPSNTGLTAASPPHPWYNISADYFGPIPDGRHILVARCDLTRFLAALFVRTPSTEHTIGAFRHIFGKYGVPTGLRTDNGAAFTSQAFARFVDEVGIVHSLSPPYHPRSNPAECAMKVVGKAIKMSDQTPAGMEHALSETRFHTHNIWGKQGGSITRYLNIALCVTQRSHHRPTKFCLNSVRSQRIGLIAHNHSQGSKSGGSISTN
ncbi:uncharacterized protein K02A2.6-like [Tigriopus californicus]|uniref:uncharacterized protein K02A2.6-like n=1 Tax=Tigriopus californicus TaxID=6832 RepID=UPI0027DA63AA|nr:uncharacterized protein K02A2.6-like [Tigriopus californicus]